MMENCKNYSMSKFALTGTLMLMVSVAGATDVGDTIAKSIKVKKENLAGKTFVQQTKITVSGVVEDQYGAVIGANVVEKGTTNGTVTDMDGKFTLDVSPTAILVVSYIGYKEQQIAVNNKKSFTIRLEEDSERPWGNTGHEKSQFHFSSNAVGLKQIIMADQTHFSRQAY